MWPLKLRDNWIYKYLECALAICKTETGSHLAFDTKIKRYRWFPALSGHRASASWSSAQVSIEEFLATLAKYWSFQRRAWGSTICLQCIVNNDDHLIIMTSTVDRKVYTGLVYVYFVFFNFQSFMGYSFYIYIVYQMPKSFILLDHSVHSMTGLQLNAQRSISSKRDCMGILLV